MKKTIRNILLWVTSAFMSLSVIGLVALMPKTEKAAAETATWQTGTFEMDDGASLALSKKGGLRFIVRMDETVKTFITENTDVEFGFRIAPKNLMIQANGDYLNMSQYVGGAADKAKIYQDEETGEWLANGCITSVKGSNLTRSFTAVAYIKQGETVRYTAYNDLARNNLYDTVNMAVLTGDYTQDLFGDYKAGSYVQNGENVGWYGSAQYPIVVDSVAEYNNLITVAAQSYVDLSQYHVIVNSDVSYAASDFAEAPASIQSKGVYTVNKLITALPDSVSMPDAIGQIPRIREAEDAFNALKETEKTQISGVAKLNSLLRTIKGYDRVYKHDFDDGTAVSATLHNPAPTIGVTATTRQDSVEGNVLKITPQAGGKAGLLFKNFPDVSKYKTIYFKARVIGGDGQLYMAAGAENGGWGADWKNNVNYIDEYNFGENFQLFSVDVTSGYIGTDFAMTLYGDEKIDLSLEITDIYGLLPEAPLTTSLTFGTFTPSGTTNEYGTVYNFTQGWSSDTDLGAFNTGALSGALKEEEHNSLYFYVYNPNDTAVDFMFKGDMNSWIAQGDYVTNLAAKAWTKVVVTPEIISQGDSGNWFVSVTSGAGTAGWQITDLVSFSTTTTQTEAALEFGVKTDTGTTNEYGKVYNISQEAGLSGTTNGLGILQTNKLASALPSGYEYFYFWMYNPTATAYNFHLAGSVNTESDTDGTVDGWMNGTDIALTPNAWTKITISATDIELNKQGTWYVYILGGSGTGATETGWQISTIYAGPDVVNEIEIIYLDHADVKATVKLIDAIPATVSLADKATIEKARASYDALTAEQQSLVGNYAKLTAAEAALNEFVAAQNVIDQIEALDPNNIDATAVANARSAYDALTDTQKAQVTNLAKLELCEKILSVIQSISALPDSVTMPDHVVFVPRIEAARDAYEALPDENEAAVTNYAKLQTLLDNIKGYETVHIQTVDAVNVIPSTVPNYTSDIGGTATIGYDSYYGNYLKVTPNDGGRAAIQFKNFPDVSRYSKVYFNVRVVGTSCDIYLSDVTGNTGKGSSWSIEGFWTNDGNWIQKEVYVCDWMLSSNWTFGLRTTTTDVSFEITDIVGVVSEHGSLTKMTFGNFTRSTETYQNDMAYNFTQGWSSATDMGAFNPIALNNALADSTHDTMRFWIYNPNSEAVDIKLTGDMNNWGAQDATTLAAKAWTEVTFTIDAIEENIKGSWFVSVSSGAKTTGWKISPIYSYCSKSVNESSVATVQGLIDALSATSLDEEKINEARELYEALNEYEKAAVNSENLIACEEQLYDNGSIVGVLENYTIYRDYTDAMLLNAIKDAANYTSKHINAATGRSASVVREKPETLTKYSHAIVFGHQDLYERLKGSEFTPAYGDSGFYIEKIGRTVFVLASDAEGYHLGALALLNKLIGYDMLAEDCVIYDTTNYDANMDNEWADTLTQTPSFAYRQQSNTLKKEEAYGMGLKDHTDLWIASANGMDMHNALEYCPIETDDNGNVTNADFFNDGQTQLCPTAHGNSAQYTAMVNTIVTNMVGRINALPTIENIALSVMDSTGDDACTCTRCAWYTSTYGSFAAAWIDLMNDVNAGIREQIGNSRKLTVAFMAYRSTETAPTNTAQHYTFDTDGNSVAEKDTDGNPVPLKCDKGVAVWLAPINAKFAENLNHADNADQLANIQKWKALTDDLYVMMYNTNYSYSMYPYNTWQASAENYKILAEFGVKGIWNFNLDVEKTKMTAFTDLKSYIDSKFMTNANADYETVLSTYFTNYFGSAAAATMRSLFDKIVAKCDEIESNNSGLGRGIYDKIENVAGFMGYGAKTYWEKDWCEVLVTLCEDAKDAVDADTTLSDDQKEVFKNRITKESLFPRYVLCTFFEKTDDRAQFKEDAKTLGVYMYSEEESLSALYSDWGV